MHQKAKRMRQTAQRALFTRWLGHVTLLLDFIPREKENAPREGAQRRSL
jgi:hypothetical protein